MKKIDTWLFIVFFAVLYLTFFWLISFVALPFLVSKFSINNTYAIYATALGVSFLASFLAAFGLRNYYVLPTSLLRLTAIIVVLQFILNAFNLFFEKPTISIIGDWFLTALGTWVVVYFAFKLSDSYFSKQ